MADTSVQKLNSHFSPRGEMGQKYLAAGITMDMRLWDGAEPGDAKPAEARPYETIGYVIAGRAELHIEGQMVLLEPGDSWVVPRGSAHTYRILEQFTAVECCHPAARVHGRDEQDGPEK